MANRLLSDAYALDKSVVTLAGPCTVGIASAGVTANNILGATLSRTATGAFTITFDDVWPELLYADVKILKATAQDLTVQFVALSLSSKTLTFKTLTGATATDMLEAGTFFIKLVFKNSTIAP